MLTATGLILVGSIGIQTSSALSASLFSSYGPLAVSALRMTIAATLLLVVLRPTLRGRTRLEWTGIVVYGVAMATMNLCLYAAVDRIPLGVAVTLEFLGPCAVAVLASRHLREIACAVLALIGVAIISLGPWGYFDLLGYLAALGAAVAFGTYTIFADKVGKSSEGLSGLALSVAVAAVVTLPFGIGHAADVSGSHWLLLGLSACIGVVVPYSVDTIAGRITSARVIGTLFAIDPAMATLVGLVALDQAVTVTAVVGILLVSVAGALVVWSAGTEQSDKSHDEAAAPGLP